MCIFLKLLLTKSFCIKCALQFYFIVNGLIFRKQPKPYTVTGHRSCWHSASLKVRTQLKWLCRTGHFPCSIKPSVHLCPIIRLQKFHQINQNKLLQVIKDFKDNTNRPGLSFTAKRAILSIFIGQFWKPFPGWSDKRKRKKKKAKQVLLLDYTLKLREHFVLKPFRRLSQ